tara:strand:+ start:1437 stop:1736 length:300 start_codon:yes stop_codon:yes gene_type:complete
MNSSIKNIWIESEESNDNTDVIVTLQDNNRYAATFFTYENIVALRMKNQKSGECLNGRFFWASDMILVERASRIEIEEIIEHLLDEKEFTSIFKKIKEH